ncbi:MAG: hypothetical protein H0U97_08750 [Gammaproteobacteria bacterium]|nr:hypothetical protein [Gammaproteobacteria bacterium]
MTMMSTNVRRGMLAGVFVLAAYPGLSPGAEQKRPAPSTRIAAILVQAERALAEDRLTLPSGHNAVSYAQEVLDLAPGHPAAQGILRAVVTRYGLIAGAAVDRAEALRRQELARARAYRSRGEGVAHRFNLSTVPLSAVAERMDGVEARPREASGVAGQPPGHRVLARLVGKYLYESEVALEDGRVQDARRYWEVAAQIARDHRVSNPGLDGIERRVAAAEQERDERRVAAAEQERDESRVGAREAARVSAQGRLLKAVFIPPSF